MTGSLTIKLGGSGGGGGSSAWGSITGTLSNQTDLQSALNALIPTGYIMHSMINVANPGWVRMHGGTIGKAGSGATERANADTEALYVALWTADVAGAFAISGGRGASGAADFAAGKTMTLPDARGAVVAAVPPTGFMAGGFGYIQGAYEHTLVDAELPVVGDHQHDYTTRPSAFSVDSGGTETVVISGSTTTDSTSYAGAFGGGLPHNNVQPTLKVGAIYVKL